MMIPIINILGIALLLFAFIESMRRENTIYCDFVKLRITIKDEYLYMIMHDEKNTMVNEQVGCSLSSIFRAKRQLFILRILSWTQFVVFVLWSFLYIGNEVDIFRMGVDVQYIKGILIMIADILVFLYVLVRSFCKAINILVKYDQTYSRCNKLRVCLFYYKDYQSVFQSFSKLFLRVIRKMNLFDKLIK